MTLRPYLLAPLAVAVQTACLHSPVRAAREGERFEFDAVSVRAPQEPGWTVQEGGAGDAQWVRFSYPPRPPAQARRANASQEPRRVREGSPDAFLEEVRKEAREARGAIDELRITLTREEVHLDDRFGPLSVRTSARGVLPKARPGEEVIFLRGYDFVLPERPDRLYRVSYLEVGPEWSSGTGFEERATAFFEGVIPRAPVPGGSRAPPREVFEQGVALGAMAARLRGVSLSGIGLQLPWRLGLPARSGPGSVGIEFSLDLFGGRNDTESRGGFSATLGAMVYRSWGLPWLGGGLDLGYAALTHLQGGTGRIDGIALGPHLAGGMDWGTLFLRFDLLAATPLYYRVGALLGVRWEM